MCAPCAYRTYSTAAISFFVQHLHALLQHHHLHCPPLTFASIHYHRISVRLLPITYKTINDTSLLPQPYPIMADIDALENPGLIFPVNGPQTFLHGDDFGYVRELHAKEVEEFRETFNAFDQQILAAKWTVIPPQLAHTHTFILLHEKNDFPQRLASRLYKGRGRRLNPK